MIPYFRMGSLRDNVNPCSIFICIEKRQQRIPITYLDKRRLIDFFSVFIRSIGCHQCSYFYNLARWYCKGQVMSSPKIWAACRAK